MAVGENLSVDPGYGGDVNPFEVPTHEQDRALSIRHFAAAITDNLKKFHY